jgi:hypothetical protein
MKRNRLRTQYVVEVQEDNNNGGVGLMLRGGFDGGEYEQTFLIHDARLLAHDILEHVPGPEYIGTGADEFQALAMVAHVRPEFGEVLKYDVSNTLSEDYEGTYWEVPPEVHILDDVVVRQLRSAAVRGTDMYRDEYPDLWEVNPDTVSVLQVARQIYKWLAFGYVQGTAHYGTLPVCDMFHRITEQATILLDRYRSEEYIGCTFDLTLDWNDTTVLVSSEPTNWMNEDE